MTNGLDGSPISHTITYTNATSETTCDSTNILASSCIKGVCRDDFNMSRIANCQNLLTTDLIVRVLSTNVLGNRPSNNLK